MRVQIPIPAFHVFIPPAVHTFCPLSYPQFSVSYLFFSDLVICSSSLTAPSPYISAQLASSSSFLSLSLLFFFFFKFCTSSILCLFPNLQFLCRPPTGLIELKSLRALEYLFHSIHLHFRSNTNGFLSLPKIMKTVPHAHLKFNLDIPSLLV